MNNISIEERLRLHEKILSNVIALQGNMRDELAVITLQQMTSDEARQNYAGLVLKGRELQKEILEQMEKLTNT